MLAAVRSILLCFFVGFAFDLPLGHCQDSQSVSSEQSAEDSALDPDPLESESDEAIVEELSKNELSKNEESATTKSTAQSNLQLNIARFEAFKKYVYRLDTHLAHINRVFSSVLLYDFGTSRLKQFGAAEIERQSAKDFFGAPNCDAFNVQVPAALANFKIRYGTLPANKYEANAAIAEAGVTLPPPPKGVAYAYDSEAAEFLVEPQGTGVPFIAAWLLLGGVYLTLRMRLINIRGILHAIALAQGKYYDSHKLGQLTHFRAFASSLASTVGLGAIGGVAIAVSVGGPGAAFWIMVCGLIGMSTKFTECALGQIYRRVSSDGVVMGGPMRYLQVGFRPLRFMGFSMAPLGSLLAWLFAAVCVCVSVIVGSTFQVSQSLGSLQTVKGLEFLQVDPWIYGLFMMAIVAIVVFGGVKIMGRVTGLIAPLMCLIYVCACCYIIAINQANVEAAFKAIFIEAFRPQALFAGSFVGVMIIGITRASLTSDAGLGTASIVHAAARTDEPVREGIISLLEPLIVTVAMCLLTALALGVTGVASTPEGQALATKDQGTALVLMALSNGMPVWFSYFLHATMFLFAFATCITWAYFGERCFVYLFGEGYSKLFKFIFIVFTFLGSVLSAANVMQFSLLLMLTLAIPNLIGVLILNDIVREELDDYWHRYRTGKLQRKKAVA